MSMSTEKSNQNVILYGVIPSTSYPLLIIFEMMLCFFHTTLTLEDEYTPLLLIFTIWVVICQGKNSSQFIQGMFFLKLSAFISIFSLVSIIFEHQFLVGDFCVFVLLNSQKELFFLNIWAVSMIGVVLEFPLLIKS